MKLYRTFSLLCLCLLLSSALLPLSAFAEAPEASPYVQWEISTDGNTVTASDGRVFRALASAPLPLKPAKTARRYVYYETLYLQGYHHEIASPARDSGLLYLNGNRDRFYVTDAAAPDYEVFLSGEGGTPYLTDSTGDCRAPMKTGLALALESSQGNPVTVAAGQLQNADYYTFEVESDDRAMAYTRGTIFRLNAGVYAFLDHLTLDASHFDADGNLALRSGELTLTVLDHETVSLLSQTAEELAFDMPQTKWYEEDEVYGEGEPPFGVDPRTAAITFYLGYAIFGLLLPTATAVLCLCLGLRRRDGARRLRWLFPAALSALWLLTSLLILLLLHL